MPDAAEGKWLSNKLWILIIVAVVGFSGIVMNKYWELKAVDMSIVQKHELFKQSVDTKLQTIIEKLNKIHPE
jgi:hypothetical protein